MFKTTFISVENLQNCAHADALCSADPLPPLTLNMVFLLRILKITTEFDTRCQYKEVTQIEHFFLEGKSLSLCTEWLAMSYVCKPGFSINLL